MTKISAHEWAYGKVQPIIKLADEIWKVDKEIEKRGLCHRCFRKVGPKSNVQTLKFPDITYQFHRKCPGKPKKVRMYGRTPIMYKKGDLEV